MAFGCALPWPRPGAGGLWRPCHWRRTAWKSFGQTMRQFLSRRQRTLQSCSRRPAEARLSPPASCCKRLVVTCPDPVSRMTIRCLYAVAPNSFAS
eukprot:364952-Chlamydomonas_euryale.AAC.14